MEVIMHAFLANNKINFSFFSKDDNKIDYSTMGASDANDIWVSWPNFSLVHLEETLINTVDDESTKKNIHAYLNGFREVIESNIPRYSDQLLDNATSYIYYDMNSEQGIVVVRFNISKLISELKILIQTDEELQHHFNPRYGGCNIHMFDMIKDDLTISLFDVLKDTDCIQNYVILENLYSDG